MAAAGPGISTQSWDEVDLAASREPGIAEDKKEVVQGAVGREPFDVLGNNAVLFVDSDTNPRTELIIALATVADHAPHTQRFL